MNKRIRSLSLLLALLLTLSLFPALRLPADAAGVAINAANFPDANFRACIKSKFDKDGSDTLSDTEIYSARTLDCTSKSIADLTGVEHLTYLYDLECSRNNLTALHTEKLSNLEFLRCEYNQLTTLDVSKNSVLKTLSCGHNKLTSLDVTKNAELRELHCASNQLTSLDLTKSPLLSRLTVEYNQLPALNVTANPKLLDLYCAGNKLKALDLKSNPKLQRLSCRTNQLTALDLSKNTALRILYCEYNSIKAIDVRNMPNLEQLKCNGNLLTALDISQNPKLNYLDFCYNKISAIDLHNKPLLNTLICGATQLTSLDVSENPALRYLFCYYTRIPLLDLTQNPELITTMQSGTVTDSGDTVKYTREKSTLEVDTYTTVLTDARGVAFTAANFPDANFRAVLKSFDKDSDDWFSAKELSAVTRISCGSKSISSLTGVGYFGYLTNLYCYGNQLTKLDLQKNLFLKTLRCQNNQLTELLIGNSYDLSELRCENNKLTELDLEPHPALLYLSCGDNPLGTLSPIRCPNLEKLYCYRCQLKNLSIQENKALKILSCFGNSIQTLDLAPLSSLEELYCQQNKFTALDLSGNPYLRICSCFSNQLTKLDLSKNPYLMRLDCHWNKLSKLDVRPAKGLCYAEKYGSRTSYSDYYVDQTQGTSLIVNNGVSVIKGDPNPFEDVPEDKYYYQNVLWAYFHEPQITGGVTSVKFGPNKTCTREQIVTFLWKAYGAPEPTLTSCPFTDVKTTKYYYKPILWAVEKGITGGVSATKFGVGKGCTREQVVTFLWKAEGAPEPAGSSCPFTDVNPKKYYYKAVLWAVENGVTGGMSATVFGVGKTCTRAQVVTFLYAVKNPA